MEAVRVILRFVGIFVHQSPVGPMGRNWRPGNADDILAPFNLTAAEMGNVVKSNATPKMLKWCRERAAVSLEDAAKVVQKQPDQISAWEAGKDSPTIGQLRKLAERYRRPLMVFYLDDPKQDFTITKVKDFRSLPKGIRRRFSEELMRAIRFVQERQAWAAEFLKEEAANPVEFIQTASLAMDADEVAGTLRKQIGVTFEEQAATPNSREAFNLWRRRTETMGVFVFQVPGIPLEEMRGCALPDKWSPAVIVNSADVFVARTFTLIHEVVHLLLGEPSVSGGGSTTFNPTTTQSIERFCNSVAGRTLVPTSNLNLLVPHKIRNGVEDTIHKLAAVFRVSRAVVAFRLMEEKAITTEQFYELWPLLFGDRPKASDDTREKKIPPHVLVLSRSGEAFTRLALSAYQTGAIHGGELWSLIRLKMKYLPRLEERLAELV